MGITIALAGNPNSGKTTLFNSLTGSNQFVGNWPGVTVEKKEGKLKGNKEVTITDLPGIYSLSPYTLEEVVARNYLLNEKPDAILNIIDGTNLERNLYLSTQLLELGIPTVMAVNMMDVVEKTGDKIAIQKLSDKIGCPVYEISALKNKGVMEAAKAAIKASTSKKQEVVPYFSPEVEAAIASISQLLGEQVPVSQKRFVAIKLFERDDKISQVLNSIPDVEQIIAGEERQKDDDAESIITSDRYEYITEITSEILRKGKTEKLTTSDKIDRVVTNRWLALPIFAVVMWLVYYISVSTVGSWLTDWANDGVFGEGWSLFGMDIPGIPVLVGNALSALNVAPWLEGLILDGIVGGVGAVLGFVPQILVLFIFLAFLESCGYMARVAFIMDRIFRKFGLSGKSFIPMLIGTGCGIPGIMASRTIENERDRRMTIMTTTFIPCGAKLPIIALIAGALFNGASWVAPSAYFVGIGAIIISGIILKKTKMFAGDPAPFVMELPAYHWPRISDVLRSMWERGWSFIKKAGTIILLSTIFIWFTSNFGFVNGHFGMVEDLSDGLLAAIGRGIAWIFIPLGWGDWQAAVAAVTGLVAKENVVGTFGVLFKYAEVSEEGQEIWATLATSFTALSAYSFLVFNLLCAPCFAAMGAIRREMNNAKWFWFAVGYQTLFAYAVSLCVFQLGSLFTGGGFTIWSAVAILVVALFIYLLFRPYKQATKYEIQIPGIKKKAI
ncbi:ferrous iron transport protein B [Ohessyouella blattaphilus]|uniref:Ferrous iron transport protein B n=1 Tax=Ohessyouella blattaphilus TaxID=2949333 RepID=A0ABT1EKR8_9FIRM|nr:ferrous iron transport protein B [Ohessyouella blattaphilus]MCP1111295.1 ferrous iron transport protein B [Ohessyouella blattaphilus]MCR8564689.1 ferrous iron transport protein B [Ohessyouella blattaphilus]